MLDVSGTERVNRVCKRSVFYPEECMLWIQFDALLEASLCVLGVDQKISYAARVYSFLVFVARNTSSSDLLQWRA